MLVGRPGVLPLVEIAPGQRVPSTVPLWFDMVQQWSPAVALDDLVRASHAAWLHAETLRRMTQREIHARERLNWVLASVDAAAPGRAEAVLRVHRQALVAATEIPPAHVAVLRSLVARGVAVGLITNYDDPDGLDAMLACADVAETLAAVVCSGAIGTVKPHRRPFAAALTALKVPADRAWYVGDTWHTDVVGAHAAGLRPVWYNPRRAAPPESGADVLEVDDLTRLEELL